MKNINPDNPDTLKDQIEEIIRHEIRPVLRLHDGDLYIKSIEDGDVRVVFTGACKTCPSAQFTIEDIVAKALKEKLGDRIKNVYLVNETDEEMLNFAKQILSKKK